MSSALAATTINEACRGRDDVAAHLRLIIEDLSVLSRRCDAMCFDAGACLSEAVPGLGQLSAHFEALSVMLEGEDLAAASAALEGVARGVAAIGNGLTSEQDALQNLIDLNHSLHRHISNVDDDVRFLGAMVSYVKIELASIDQQGERLEGFSLSLEELATRTQRTLKNFQTAHKTLLSQLMQTAHVQSSFLVSHQTKLVSGAKEVDLSLEILAARRKAISEVAAEIGQMAQQISMQIAQSVVALQIGDNSRQRIEHIGDALMLAKDFLCGAPVGGLDEVFGRPHTDEDGFRVAVRVGDLESLQLNDTAREFALEMATIQSLLEQIAHSVKALAARSDDLFGSRDRASESFLGDLEQKLEVARQLIDQCEQSRAAVDQTAEAVVETIMSLEGLAASVAAMAVDMTIVGTNAIVASHRLGNRGTALSVIAQHLRSHAIRIAEGVKSLKPVLAKVLESAKMFAVARKGQDAATMAVLAASIHDALPLFNSCAIAVNDLRQQLSREAAACATTLDRAIASLDETAQTGARLEQAAAGLGHITDTIRGHWDGNQTTDDILDRMLRPKYTMASERHVHDGFFVNASRDRGQEGEGVPADCLF